MGEGAEAAGTSGEDEAPGDDVGLAVTKTQESTEVKELARVLALDAAQKSDTREEAAEALEKAAAVFRTPEERSELDTNW